LEVVHGARYIIGVVVQSGPGLEKTVISWIAILSLLQLVAFWRILGRMGFPPWLAIIASLPLVNLIVLYYVALSPWPSERPRDGSTGTGGPDARF